MPIQKKRKILKSEETFSTQKKKSQAKTKILNSEEKLSASEKS